VIHGGDVTNAGKKPQWDMFVRDYGLTGKDGRLLWPVYEAFISTSDSHYRQLDHKLGRHNDLNRASIEEINKITTVASRV
jgi:hypothetical protein